MPAYFSLEVLFPFANLHESFVIDIHNAIEKAGFKFISGYWNAENLDFKNIMEINQELLSQKFHLMLDQDISEDYKQVIYENNCNLQIRLFWMILDNEILLSINVPEDDILNEEDKYGANYSFNTTALKMMLLCAEEIWKLGLANSVQTCLEQDGPITKNQILTGVRPSCDPFLLLSFDLYKSEHFSSEKYYVERKKDGSFYLIDKNKITNDFV